MRVHGLCEHNGDPCAPIEVPAGAAREVRFKSGRVGTYAYWAETTGCRSAMRFGIDSQLSGAFVVDPIRGRGDGRPDLRHHRLDRPDARAPAEGRGSRRSVHRRVDADEDGHDADERHGVARHRALYLPRGRHRALAVRERRAASRIRCTCTASTSMSTASATACATRIRRGPEAARGDAAPADRRHDGADVDAGAAGQLAVPLSHHRARRTGAASEPGQPPAKRGCRGDGASAGARRAVPRHGAHGAHGHDTLAGMAGMVLGVTVLDRGGTTSDPLERPASPVTRAQADARDAERAESLRHARRVRIRAG